MFDAKPAKRAVGEEHGFGLRQSYFFRRQRIVLAIWLQQSWLCESSIDRQPALIVGIAEMGTPSRVRLEDLKGALLAQSLSFAVEAAAVTCSRRGADMPRRAELRPASPESALSVVRFFRTPPPAAGLPSSLILHRGTGTRDDCATNCRQHRSSGTISKHYGSLSKYCLSRLREVKPNLSHLLVVSRLLAALD